MAVFFAMINTFPVAIASERLPAQDTEKSEREDIQTFFPLLGDDTLDFDYFLDEINIVGEQQAKLKKIAKQAFKKWLALKAKEVESAGTSPIRRPPSPQHMQEELAFQKKFIAEIDDILLPHQMKDMRCLLKQRSLLQQLNCEAFEMVRRTRAPLGMSESEIVEFNKKSDQLSEDFRIGRQMLRQTAWAKIKPAMPANSTEGLTEISSLLAAESKSVLRAERVDFSELDKWADDDYQKYESKSFQNLIYGLMRNEDMQEQLGILDFQKKDMLAINARGRENVPSGISPEDRLKAIAMSASGDTEGLKALFNKRKEAELAAKQVVIDEIVNDVLLPNQVKLLKSIAKFKRLIHESKYGDQFGAAVAWSVSFGGAEFDKSNLTRVVESARREFYDELKKLRKTTCDETMKALPETSRQQFKSLYGDFYDYQSEKIANWDSFRNSTK